MVYPTSREFPMHELERELESCKTFDDTEDLRRKIVKALYPELYKKMQKMEMDFTVPPCPFCDE